MFPLSPLWFNAFMKKHRSTSSDIDDIPVLTDIVTNDDVLEMSISESPNDHTDVQAEPLQSFASALSVEDSEQSTDISSIEVDKTLTAGETGAISSNQENPAIDDRTAAPESITSVSQLNDNDAEQLARDIYIRVMSDIDGRVSRDLRLEMTKRISAMIDKTVSAAIEDFKQELANIVSDAISETLIQRTEKKSK